MIHRRDSNSIRQEIRSLIEELRVAWPAPDIPYELYHYTDAKGLIGILRDKCFWATDINFLNDATELKYSLDLIDKALDAKIKQGNEGGVEKCLEYCRLFLSHHQFTMNAYVTCFCENGNLLSQWRAYGERGAGYSIGIIAESLQGSKREGPGARIIETRLEKIIYTKSVQEHLVTETIDRFCVLLHRVLMESGEEQRDSIISEFSNDLCAELSEYLYNFKSPVFEEEQEWRVVTTLFKPAVAEEGRGLMFRVSGGNAIPYIEVGFGSPSQRIVARGYPVSSITFGPTLNPELTTRSLYELLESVFGYGNGVRIISSDIPLRSTSA